MLPVAQLSPARPFLTSMAVSDAALLQRLDAKSMLLKGLSDLEICLVIAMKRLVEMYTMQFNFEMVFDLYNEFATVHGLSYKRAVALKVCFCNTMAPSVSHTYTYARAHNTRT